MDKKGFYNYNGSVQPLPCSVHSFVFDSFNEKQAFQVFAFLNKLKTRLGDAVTITDEFDEIQRENFYTVAVSYTHLKMKTNREV